MSLTQIWANCNSCSEPVLYLANYMCYTKMGGRRKLPDANKQDFDLMQSCTRYIDLIYSVCKIFSQYDMGKLGVRDFKNKIDKAFKVCGYTVSNCECKHNTVTLEIRFRDDFNNEAWCLGTVHLSNKDSRTHTGWVLSLSDFMTILFEEKAETKKFGLSHKVSQIINIGLMADMYS